MKKKPEPTPASTAAFENPIIWRPELFKRWGNPSAVTFWRWQRAGRVPKPEVRLGRKEGWYRTTITAIEAASTARAAA